MFIFCLKQSDFSIDYFVSVYNLVSITLHSLYNQGKGDEENREKKERVLTRKKKKEKSDRRLW